jgi:nucleoside-diphosphate-sugar epimerase
MRGYKNMKTAIVTGAAGFVGVHLCEELVSNGILVTAICRTGGSAINRLPHEVTVINCNMDSYATLSDINADVFYHLAWDGATGEGRGNARLQSQNVQWTFEALEAAKRLGCGKFIAAGTVYERLLSQIIGHNGFRQADFYLLSKQYAHSMCAKLAAKIGIEFVWATFFHPIGKYIKCEQMMAYAIKGLLDNIAPTFGPAREPYDITAVENIAYGLCLLGEKQLSKNEYYIGSGSPKILLEYLEEAKAILRSDTVLKIGGRSDDGMRFDFSWYDTSALVDDTGYIPKASFEQAVRNTANYLAEAKKWMS